ncbi:alpha-hydroxy acid oxidase [Noviherbaspirillum pedocola]|uniref:Alpha-hydroxy-acid oxidizing protein n=1 Tax=Noviherbaspirillum pedocola TaxID=2801341 RepID=A0A934SYP4_9BURK|nr:alpha-hydroxy acid oxidase [Noviherbaspirillum pedocola]MBK4735362.1 alpha-hydroxy-acid oxidizing protein [Noviherbaspirillum pedocola]
MKTANIADLREQARRRLPTMFFDYIDGGSFSERTMRANEADFDDWLLDPLVLRDVSHRDLSASFLGGEHALPIVLGPVGFAGLFAGNGEAQAAQAAAAAGIPMCLSTFSICSMEEVARAADMPLYLQLYILRDRILCEEMIERARNANVKALVLTVDSAVSSIRERDTRNGFRTASRLRPGAALDMALHPRWAADMLLSRRPRLGNISPRCSAGRNFMDQVSFLSNQLDPTLRWEDIRWLKERWNGPLVIKGILTPDDARRAVDHGATAIVVSNHGGRQLDGAMSTISALPSVAAAVDGEVEIFLDGGVRRGTHIVKALALGADGVFLGRAWVYGLAAHGRSGVADAISLLRAEFDLTLALMGVTSIAELRKTGTRLRRTQPGIGNAAVLRRAS